MKLFVFLSIFQLMVGGVFAQSGNTEASPIVIKVNQPNVWTLEQAHYLLAQMHRRNLDLKTATLNGLDPNAINGVNVDVLRTLLSVSAEFDQAIGANNNLIGLNNQQIKTEKQFIAEQRRTLFIKRIELQNSSLKLTGQIAELKIKLIKAQTDDEKSKIQAQIDELIIVQEVVKEQITQISEQIETLPANDKDYQNYSSNTATTSSTPMTSVLASLANTISQQISNPPQLNASVRLDNYIQMQYEILSKQLTLLRDEVGPGERLVFMELPQSINVSYGDTKNKLAQSWWRVKGYSKCVVIDQNNELPCDSRTDFTRLKNRLPATSGELVNQLLNADYDSPPLYNPKMIYVQSNEIKSLDGLIDDFSKMEKTFVRKLSTEVAELKKDTPQSKSFFQEKAEAYKLLKDKCQQTDTKERAKNCAGSSETFEDYNAKRKELEEIILKIFRRFMDNELMIDQSNWTEISDSKRIENSTYIISKTKRVNKFNETTKKYDETEIAKTSKELRADNIFFRRIVLEEVFIGKIEEWRDVWQKLINLDNKQNRNENWKDYEDKTIRVIDLFPKQSSLNVNDIKLRTNQSAFRVAFSWLTGIGASGNYERMRERYSQFVQQELYSSAFGKGGREFGWTFYPMPGTERLMSGVRTTYAVMIVPEDTTSMIFETRGCFFPRKAIQPQQFDSKWVNSGTTKGCSEKSTLIVPLPNGGNPTANSFAVTKVSYQSVLKGEKAIVSIMGENFSSQIGVIVNGVALLPSIGIGQPFIRDDSDVGKSVISDTTNSKVKGTFERISSREIIATFEMGSDYQGTPEITLLAPGTSLSLNALKNIEVFDGKDEKRQQLKESAYIFGKKIGDGAKVTTINGIDVFVGENNSLNILVKGENLDVVKSIFINGKRLNENCEDIQSTDGKNICNVKREKEFIPLSIKIEPIPKTIKLTFITQLGTVDSSAIANPLFKEDTKENEFENFPVKKEKFSFTTFEQVTCSTVDGKIQVLYKLGGIGFTGEFKAYINKKPVSLDFDESELYLTIVNPQISQLVLLQNQRKIGDVTEKFQDAKIVTFKKPEKGCP